MLIFVILDNFVITETWQPKKRALISYVYPQHTDLVKSIFQRFENCGHQLSFTVVFFSGDFIF